MILETIAAASIYTGAIAYLASDNPVQATAPSSQSRVEMNATLASSDLDARAALRSFTTDASVRNQLRYLVTREQPVGTKGVECQVGWSNPLQNEDALG